MWSISHTDSYPHASATRARASRSSKLIRICGR
jgi:hypothetical protein